MLLPCGCAVLAEAVEPFADLATALAALEAGDANAALGHALAAGLSRPALAPTATLIARRAEASLEFLVFDDVDDQAGSASGRATASLEHGSEDGADDGVPRAADESAGPPPPVSSNEARPSPLTSHLSSSHLSSSHLSPLTSHLSPLTSHLLTSHLLTSHLSPLTSHLSPPIPHLSPLTSHPHPHPHTSPSPSHITLTLTADCWSFT